jgi:hypothetical protein
MVEANETITVPLRRPKIAPPASVRIAAALSIVLWIAVVACGRLLAYT